MKFVSFESGDSYLTGLYIDGYIYPVQAMATSLEIVCPAKMEDLLLEWDRSLEVASHITEAVKSGKINSHLKIEDVKLLSPVPRPTSCRDGYAFRQHVMTARRNRGVEMIPEFDEYPVFYFTNHLAVFGPGEIVLEEDHFKSLDFELECAIVIGKEGKNITSSEADNYIAGFMVMNDLSARVLQMEEMKLNLGPAKGKDFATTFGPFMVTPDELADAASKGEYGNVYSLSMKAFHNGKQISEGNVNQMNWTFAELIERASYGVMLHPGDVIGSGTVGTGCYLELNGTAALEARKKGESYTPVWIKEGDSISLEIERLGVLTNTFKNAGTGYSILKKKKKVN
ncbi:MAG: fumarylacetoacetate hydrolase family protein [Ignavibacteriales bacterium]|nr:MAG: fumarylacetoacetate hydrolase family protein [Ignavibacteriales bacterium]